MELDGWMSPEPAVRAATDKSGMICVLPYTLLGAKRSKQVFINQNYLKHSFAYDASNIWNKLLRVIQSATSFTSCRSELKSYLFSKAYPPLCIFLAWCPEFWYLGNWIFTP